MHIVIAAIGRVKSGPVTELVEGYRARLPWRVELKEVEAKKGLSGAALKTAEGGLLRAAMPAGFFTVALDERGAEHTSEKFAAQIARWRDASGARLAFALGGADGHGADFLATVNAKLSLGRMTWPHLLARVMLMEQLYRAHTILTGHPYHRA